MIAKLVRKIAGTYIDFPPRPSTLMNKQAMRRAEDLVDDLATQLQNPRVDAFRLKTEQGDRTEYASALVLMHMKKTLERQVRVEVWWQHGTAAGNTYGFLFPLQAGFFDVFGKFLSEIRGEQAYQAYMAEYDALPEVTKAELKQPFELRLPWERQ